MRIVFCSAEVAPFSQAGGLGEVIGSLPRALADQGVNCSILTPLYGLIDTEAYGLEETGIAFDVNFYGNCYPIQIWKGSLPRSNVSVYFVANHDLFGCRQEIYPYGKPEWELEGFLIFSQAVFELLRRLNYRPDILHIHDWHTASVSTTLSDIRAFDQYFSRTYSVLTIHNLHYQGVYGDINWLKEGIMRTDAITTVSPTYAQEIQMPEFGSGMDDVIRHCQQKVSGILNGIDTSFYNPETDPNIACHYNAGSAMSGKTKCKEVLQKELGLPVNPDAPLLSFVGRLVDQKGLDILLPAIEMLVTEGSQAQWVILGNGDPHTEAAVKLLSDKFDTVKSMIDFSVPMAQKLYAASDMFLMPSAFEPCGLGQMIALRYGAVPIVRGVGGLVDTIVDVRLQPHRGNGFKFNEYTETTMREVLTEALNLFQNKRVWKSLVERGMKEDHSWDASSRVYLRLYEGLLKKSATVSESLPS